MTVTAPYGEWVSPLTAADVAAGSHAPDEARYVGDDIWWSEPVAAERRTALLRRTPDGVETVLPAPWNVRSAVHEYGGGAWTAVGGSVVFSHLCDHRLHALDRIGDDPRPLTPEGHGFRFGGLVPARDAVLAVRETMTGPAPSDVRRDLVLVPLDGSAAHGPERITSVVAGSRFLAQPRISSDGTRLAWIAWDHPRMPWDGTELRVGDLDDDGRVGAWEVLLGGREESVLQPEWLADGRLLALTDRSGWWNLGEVSVDGFRPLLPQDRETGGPLWVLGSRWYLPLADGRTALTATLGTDEQVLLDADGGRTLLRADRSGTAWQDARGPLVLLTDQSAADPASLWQLDTRTGAFELIRSGAEGLPRDLLPEARLVEIDGVHAVVYPPTNPGFTAPEGELPPYVAFVHGGPTSQAGVRVNPAYVYCTSRGIGVVDVDYGGSTGYGRAYRRRLDGAWGVVDVDDVLTVVRGLAAQGVADGSRLAIEGGSAGGWTVLAALTRSDVFACGVSKYGVADAVALLTGTHDFEAQYLDRLIGPYPEAAHVYAERAPINHVEGLSAPVLLLQGLDDRVVPPEQSRVFRDALAARHVPHALIEFAGEGHGFRGRDTLIAAREASLSFLGQVLGFEPPGVPRLALER